MPPKQWSKASPVDPAPQLHPVQSQALDELRSRHPAATAKVDQYPE
ncbi:MAG: hypothetical protein AAF289_00105 [Cyanobacteria bacterium P01_A01_bin.135]